MSGSSGWSDAGVVEQLDAENFDVVVNSIATAITYGRDPRIVNWCTEYGYRRGHVPVLFNLTWNALRFSKGSVPNMESLTFGIKCAVILLLRTAQDVVSCKLDLAKSNVDYIYADILQSVRHWVLRWNEDVLPSTEQMHAEIAAWLASRADPLPLPVWATCYYSNMFSRVWGQPKEHDTVAFRRSETVNATRTAVADKFMSELQRAADLNTFFKIDLKMFQ